MSSFNTIQFNDSLRPLKKAYKFDSVNVCFCTSNKYSPYCGIAIQSILCNSDKKKYYDILILEYDVSSYNKNLIISLTDNYPNVKIRFVNMKEGLRKIKIQSWAHFSIVACFKLFLFSNVFSNYDKMLALDTDLVFLKDSAELFNNELGDNFMAAVDDVIMKSHIKANKSTAGFAPRMPVCQYIEEYLGFGSVDCYYNTGVVLLNLKKYRSNNAYERAFKLLKMKGYTYQEQDVLNEISVNKIKKLDYKWNLVGTDMQSIILDGLTEDETEMYNDALEAPYVIHYAGGIKPWTHKNVPYSEYFFKYAKLTPWYENILLNISTNYVSYDKTSNDGPNRTSFKVKVWLLANKVFPLKTKRREFIKKLFPRGSYRRIFFSELLTNMSSENIKKRKEMNEVSRKNTFYIKNLRKKILRKRVLLDSKNGTDLAGNIFHLIEELSKEPYEEYKIYLTYQEKYKNRISIILNNYGLKKVKLIEWNSKKYYILLARCQFLVTDLYMPSEFVKRKEQVLLSTAHGTPLKVMGKDCHTETQGHLQKTHATADFQTFPNRYMKEKLFNAFMENNLSVGTSLKSGYCRNEIFFDQERRKEVRKTYGFENKKIIAYLPTFRGIAGSFKSRKQIDDIVSFCEKLENMLDDNELFLVKLHNFNSEIIDFSMFSHIKLFPLDLEVYDVLNATDVLVSDYSSVFFDYANTGNKIILFQYDYEDYMKERGTYLSWAELPFPIVYSVEDLYHEISSSKNYDDNKFIEEYCNFDKPNVTTNVCSTVFKNVPKCETFASSRNGKKNIVIHIGNFDLRSQTTYLVQNFFNKIDTSKANYYVFFYEYDLFNKAFRLECLPKNVEYFSYLSGPQFSKKESKLYNKHLNHDNDFSSMKPAFERECRRHFVDYPIDLFIDLSGRIPYVSEFSKYLNCPKGIVEHTDFTLSKNCMEYYDVIFSFKENNSESKCEKIREMKSGYSDEVLDYNVKIIEKFCLDFIRNTEMS